MTHRKPWSVGAPRERERAEAARGDDALELWEDDYLAELELAAGLVLRKLCTPIALENLPLKYGGRGLAPLVDRLQPGHLMPRDILTVTSYAHGARPFEVAPSEVFGILDRLPNSKFTTRERLEVLRILHRLGLDLAERQTRALLERLE